jgi:hypothetical protein
MHQQLCEYKVEEKTYLWVCARKRFNITGVQELRENTLNLCTHGFRLEV